MGRLAQTLGLTMCNASNHPPECRCGFGAGTNSHYFSTSRGGYGQSQTQRPFGAQLGTKGNLAGGYVDPNATCPVCGAKVYFYKSPFDGRVYFESLGPPWTKHPCTSRAGDVVPPLTSERPWNTDGWEPLIEVDIQTENLSKGLYKISGLWRAEPIALYFRADETVFAEIVRVKVLTATDFQISILGYDQSTKEWSTWDGICSRTHPKFNAKLQKLLKRSQGGSNGHAKFTFRGQTFQKR